MRRPSIHFPATTLCEGGFVYLFFYIVVVVRGSFAIVLLGSAHYEPLGIVDKGLEVLKSGVYVATWAIGSGNVGAKSALLFMMEGWTQHAHFYVQ